MKTAQPSKSRQIPLNIAALIAGLGILVMVFTAPVAQFGIFPKLFDSANPAQTFENLIQNRDLFALGILLNYITLICDVIVAWALYLFFKPTLRSLSLLAAWFRLIYTAVSFAALMNMVKVFNYTRSSKLFANMDQSLRESEILFYYSSFWLEWSFAFLLFGICLCLLGVLAYRSPYVPKIMGVLLILAGLGYFIDNLGAFLYRSFDTSFLFVTFFGELIFMIWLIVKGFGLKGKIR